MIMTCNHFAWLCLSTFWYRLTGCIYLYHTVLLHKHWANTWLPPYSWCLPGGHELSRPALCTIVVVHNATAAGIVSYIQQIPLRHLSYIEKIPLKQLSSMYIQQTPPKRLLYIRQIQMKHLSHIKQTSYNIWSCTQNGRNFNHWDKNSLAHGESGSNPKSLIFKLIWKINNLSISCEIPLKFNWIHIWLHDFILGTKLGRSNLLPWE